MLKEHLTLLVQTLAPCQGHYAGKTNANRIENEANWRDCTLDVPVTYLACSGVTVAVRIQPLRLPSLFKAKKVPFATFHMATYRHSVKWVFYGTLKAFRATNACREAIQQRGPPLSGEQ